MSPAHRLPRSLRLLPLIAGLAAAGAAYADDPNPYSIGASETITRQSNVFGVADGGVNPKVADTVYTTSLIGGFDQSIGRQHVFGNVNLRNNHYADTSSLNNNGYGANLGLDWSTIDRISGTVRYVGNRSLAMYNADGGQFVSSKNIETSQQLDFLARIGVVTRLTGELGYSYRKLSDSSVDYSYREFDQNAISAGLRYSTSSALNFGLAYRHTDGDTPNYPTSVTTDATTGTRSYTFAKDDYKRNDIDLTSVWTPTGASTFNGRLSYGKVEHSLANQRSFSGATGDISWNWRPTGKLQFVTDLIRDTGQESTFYLPATANQNTGAGAVGANSRVATTIQIAGTYAATAKISLNATLSSMQRSLVSTIDAGQSFSGKDRTNQIALGAHWDPTRSIEVGCTYSNIRRTSDVPQLSLPYSANTYGCYGQFLLQ